MNIIRIILSILFGLSIGFVATAAIQVCSLLMHDIPPDVINYDEQQMAQFIATLPMSAFIMVWISDGASAFCAAAAATIVAPRKAWNGIAWLFGAVFLAAGVANLTKIPHPLWFAVVDLLLYLPCALLGCWLMNAMFGDELPLVGTSSSTVPDEQKQI